MIKSNPRISSKNVPVMKQIVLFLFYNFKAFCFEGGTQQSCENAAILVVAHGQEFTWLVRNSLHTVSTKVLKHSYAAGSVCGMQADGTTNF